MTEINDLVFEIKDEGNLVRLHAFTQPYPRTPEWIRARVSVKGGAFSGEFSTDFRIDDFSSFKEQLAVLHTNLKGGAYFYNIEGQIELKIAGDGLGHFEVDVVADDRSDASACLNFTMNFDQTILHSLVAQLDKIVKQFNTK